jgi:CRISPR-associated endonuclease Csn1
LYHLSERRGFKSNRRTDRQADDTGVVKEGIAALQAALGGKTLGQYFAETNPANDRIRSRYTGRDDYENEFARIIEAQRPHHSCLTPKTIRRLRRHLFWQRPLRSQKGLIGKCSILTNHRRCPMAHPVAQEFRLLQAVNHLAIIHADGELRGLEPEERAKLLEALNEKGDLTFAAVRKLLGLKKADRFNLEEGGEKKMPGNRTHRAMCDAIGSKWIELPAPDKARLVGIVRGSNDATDLRGQLAAQFPELLANAAELDKVALEDKPAAHCKKVLAALVERMADGSPYATARADFEAQHGLGKPTDPVDQLPPVLNALPGITNPAVIRALTELRKVVNEVVRLHGKPDMVRIELARDLKKPRQVRQKMAARMRAREGERSAASQQLRSHGITNPSRADIEKVLLAEECGWQCPYTGTSFGMHDLVGATASVDVEHIFPRRYLDDSFANKTLCVGSENRAVKKDRLPHQAYSGHADRYREILDRVRAFNSDLRDEKLRRFMADTVEPDFASRQLIDTAYTSRIAARYMGLLYGGIVDVRSDKRVRTSTGRMSALLRSAWKLNSILGTVESPKGRGIDHRHHAIDALVVALSSDSLIKQVADAAGRFAERSSGRWLIDVPEQDGLFEQAAKRVKAIVVSHRLDRRLAGRLHEDSLYSGPRVDNEGKEFHVIRKPLAALTPADITGDKIVDPHVRRLVQEAYAKACAVTGKSKPSDVFADPVHLPALPNRNGPPVPIRKVRMRVRSKAMAVGDADHRRRYVMQDKDGLHHTVISSARKGSREVWVEAPASRLDVQNRLRQKQQIVRPDETSDTEMMFHLCKGDSIELDTADGGRAIYVVRGIAATDISVVPAFDASTDNRSSDTRIRSPNKLRERNPRPVVVTPAGRVFERGR